MTDFPNLLLSLHKPPEVMQDIHLKYLAVNPQDLHWGIAVNSVGCQQIGPGDPYPPVGHPARYLFSEERGRILNEYQLLYISEGRGRFRSASTGRWLPIQAGNFFLLHPGEWHSYRPDPDTGWKEYWIGFEGPIIDDRIRNGFFPKEKPVLRAGIRSDVIDLYEQAIQAATEQKSGFQPLLGSIVVHLTGLAYYYDRQDTFSEADELINRAKIIIADEYRTIGPEEVAEHLCMGYSNFRKTFKEYTGFSPAQYIREVRLNKVKEALTNSTLPVKQIAYEFGYENYDYFFTAFRRLTGMTPSDYRDLTRGTEQKG